MILTTKKAAHIAKLAEFVWFVWLCSNVQTVFWPVQGCNFKKLEVYEAKLFATSFLPDSCLN